MLRNWLITLLLIVDFSWSIENSITTMIDQVESIEFLKPEKYTQKQYQEILEALSHKEEKLRIMTYNMLFDRYDHNLEEVDHWPNRMPRIVELIRTVKPDLIGTQELFANQVEEISAELEDTYVFISKPSQSGELNGIFYNKDRLEVLEPILIQMTDAEDILTGVHVKDMITGKELVYLNAHFKFSNIEKREQQAEIVQKTAETYAQNCAVVVSGDLNTFPHRLDLSKFPFYDGDYIMRILTKQALKNAQDIALLGHLGPLSTFTNEPDDNKPFKGLGTPGVMLDRMLVTDKATPLVHAVEPATVDEHFPSDHMPIILDLLAK